jgi:hypothetical protein
MAAATKRGEGHEVWGPQVLMHQAAQDKIGQQDMLENAARREDAA